MIKLSAQVGWLAGGKYFVCDAGYLELNSGLNRYNQCNLRKRSPDDKWWLSFKTTLAAEFCTDCSLLTFV